MDGYLYVTNAEGKKGFGFIANGDTGSNIAVGGNEGVWSVPVLKGWRLYKTGEPSGIYFAPITGILQDHND